jgi:hypothetical protein
MTRAGETPVSHAPPNEGHACCDVKALVPPILVRASFLIEATLSRVSGASLVARVSISP